MYIKKCICLFNKKNTFTCWTRLKTAKPLTTAKQLIRKNSCLLFEKSGYFLGLNRSLCSFSFAF